MATATIDQNGMVELDYEKPARIYAASKEAVKRTANRTLMFFKGIWAKMVETANKAYSFIKECAISAVETISQATSEIVEVLKTSKPVEMFGIALFATYDVVLGGLGYLAASGLLAAWVISLGIAMNLAFYASLAVMAALGTMAAVSSGRNQKKERVIYFEKGYKLALAEAKPTKA